VSWFVNYLAHPVRSSPLNLIVARVIISLYALWKIGTYPFGGLADFPEFLFMADTHAVQNQFFAFPQPPVEWVRWEQGIICLCLVLFGLGWRTGLTSVLAAFLLSHLSGLNYLIATEKTFLPIIYFLILYGLFRHELEGRPGVEAGARKYRMSCLTWFLVGLSLLYFFTGFAKFKGGGWSFDWAAGSNLRAILWHNAMYHIHETPPVMAWLLPHGLVCTIIGWSTMALELGFAVAVLMRRSITPFVLGLAGMHAGIVLTMQVNYLGDFGVLYLTLIPWDDVVARWRRGTPA